MANAGNRQEVTRAEREAKLLRQQQLEEVRKTVSTRAGRNVFWRIFGDGGIFRLSFTGNSTTFFNEGMRNLALKYLNEMIEADLPAFIFMLIEQHRPEEDPREVLNRLIAIYTKRHGSTQ